MDYFTENSRLSHLFSSHDSSHLTNSELSTCVHILSKYTSNEGGGQSSKYYFKASDVADDVAYDRGVDFSAHIDFHGLGQQELKQKTSTFSLTALSILSALEQEHHEFNFDLSGILDKHAGFVTEQYSSGLKFDFTI